MVVLGNNRRLTSWLSQSDFVIEVRPPSEDSLSNTPSQKSFSSPPPSQQHSKQGLTMQLSPRILSEPEAEDEEDEEDEDIYSKEDTEEEDSVDDFFKFIHKDQLNQLTNPLPPSDVDVDSAQNKPYTRVAAPRKPTQRINPDFDLAWDTDTHSATGDVLERVGAVARDTQADAIALHTKNLPPADLDLDRLLGVGAFILDQNDALLYDKSMADMGKPSSSTLSARYLGLRFDFCVDPPPGADHLRPHYVILREAVAGTHSSPKQNSTLEVYRHSMPAFVPVERLALRHLNSNTTVFARKLREYLVFYNARRQFFEAALDEHERRASWTESGRESPKQELLPPCVVAFKWNPEYTVIELILVSPMVAGHEEREGSDGHEEVTLQELTVACSPKTNIINVAKISKMVRSKEDVDLLRRLQRGNLTIECLGQAIGAWQRSIE